MASIRKCSLLLLIVSILTTISSVITMDSNQRLAMRDEVKKMFYHAYDNYMEYAFPHDELKPLSRTYTDSLGELGNLKLEHLSETYNGTALTLIESLSSLAIIGNKSEFEKGVLWLADRLSFDIDVRVNVFECNIRLLGGLISAHLLAKESKRGLLKHGYNNQLLILAEDLGKRLLPAFETPTGIPYAWINLRHGVIENETTETSTSGSGSLILEMGSLSHLTGNMEYENVALRALQKLWDMRSPLNLLGTTLDVSTGQWIEYSSGIGAGVDSYYEYLIKAYILFGKEEHWDMFYHAYVAVQRHFRHGPWYHDADMRTGRPTYWQLTSLQAFWPGLQVLIGDIEGAKATHQEFFTVWEKYGVLPERYLFDKGVVHPTERYYPIRPELAESTFFLYQATKDPWYLEVGRRLVNSLNVFSRVTGGFASIRDVLSMELEDHQHSYFLSETCKYLYLLFDDSALQGYNYIFSTEGHPLPVLFSWHRQRQASFRIDDGKDQRKGEYKLPASSLTGKICPLLMRNGTRQVESACHVLDTREDHRCRSNKDCGVDAVNCQSRTCSRAGYCGILTKQIFL